MTSDVVSTWAEAHAERPPLVVLEGLEPLIPGSGPITVERLGSGHSNETFLVLRDGRPLVLRRPPRPPLPATAHDVVREGRILEILTKHDVRAPRPIAIYEEDDAIGAPFYLMEMVPGVVIRDQMPASIDDPQGRRDAVSEFVDALVEVHAVEWRRNELETIAPATGYLGRQLRRWKSQWEQNRTRSVPEIDAIGLWLEEEMPPAEETTLVHGDAKLDNAIYRDAWPVHLEALVDWEMSTLGDPLADLGLMCATYVEPGEDVDPVLGFSPATSAPGSPARREIASWYGERTGRNLDALHWYEVLALWKIMILLEASYKRYLAATTDDPFFALLEDGIPRIAADVAARTQIGGT